MKFDPILLQEILVSDKITNEVIRVFSLEGLADGYIATEWEPGEEPREERHEMKFQTRLEAECHYLKAALSFVGVYSENLIFEARDLTMNNYLNRFKRQELIKPDEC